MRILLFFIVCFSVLFGDNSTQQIITFSVAPMNELGPVEGPSPIFVLDGKDGSCATSSSMITLFTNEENKKIIAYLDQDMPVGVSLYVTLAPPSGARSTGKQKLSATPVDVLVEVSKVSASQLSLSYQIEVTAASKIASQQTRIVTYTMTDG